MTNIEAAFGVQRRVRGPWRRYLDCLAPFRSELHRYCCRLTGNIWDGEDLVQDTLLRVFGMLGKIDVQFDNPNPTCHGCCWERCGASSGHGASQPANASL